MSNASDFIIENGVLKKYAGPGGDVIVPEDVIKIGYHAFYNCHSLINITIPTTVTEIEMFAFTGCTNLQNVILPPAGASLDLFAFSDCSNLREITIPGGTWLGGGAFSGCTSLERVTILDGMTAIGKQVFENCSNLQHIHIPSSVEGINSKAFVGCNAVRTLVCPPKLFSKVFSDGSVTSYLLGDYSLEDALLLHVNKRIQRSKKQFFESIVGKNSDAAAAKFLEACQSISLDELNEFLALSADVGSNLVSAVLLAYKNDYYTAAEIENHEVKKEGKSLGTIPMTLDDWKKLYSLAVDGKKVSIKKYKGDEENIIVPAQMEGLKVTSIQARAFSKCTSLKNIVISEGIKEIENEVFSGCNSLESISIPNSVKKLDNFLFKGCSSLERVSFSDSIKFGYGIFSGCKALKHIDLPAGLSKIDGCQFKGCSSLQEITIPDGVKEICWEAFSGCRSLKAVVLPESLTKIGEEAFSGCSNLSDITLHAGVKKIEKDSFDGCKKLTIHAPVDNYAETYAKKNNIPFVAE